MPLRGRSAKIFFSQCEIEAFKSLEFIKQKVMNKFEISLGYDSRFSADVNTKKLRGSNSRF